MDLKTASALRRLRLISAPEAASFLILMVCSVLRRTTDLDLVPVMGAVHGVLWVAYVLLWADAWNRAKWSLKTAAWYFLMSVLPLGGFFAERRLRRLQDDAVIAARARSEGVVSA
ncbi:DUF3817 domain-containing protein [Streptomyces avicenniae]|uniref:DUF3817 domain-containing protein n=1 Tax=Streptomyces avicenniae TaxID=500153 RepID=UPI00069AB872|nr:DUF3817 domain-containing protein [Streptomyces avicenniae]